MLAFINFNLKKWNIIIYLFVSALSPLAAQNDNDCYKTLVNKGMRLYNDALYEQAINKYLAALNCDVINQTELAGLIEKAQQAREEQLINARDSAVAAQNRALISQKQAQIQRDSAVEARKAAERQSKRNKALSYAYLAEQEAEKDPVKGLLLAKLGYEQTDTVLPWVKLALSNIVNKQFVERGKDGNRNKFGQPIPIKEFILKPGGYKIHFDKDYIFLFDQIHGYSVTKNDSLFELVDLQSYGSNSLHLSNDLNSFSAIISGVPGIYGLKKHSILPLQKPDTSIWGEVIFSKSNKLFGALGLDAQYYVWDSTGNIVRRINVIDSLEKERYSNEGSTRFIRHDKAIWIHRFGAYFVSSGLRYEHLVKIWDFASNEVRELVFISNNSHIEYANDGMKFILSDTLNRLALYHISGQLIKYLEIPKNLSSFVIFTPDDSRIYIFCEQDKVFICNGEGKFIREFRRPSGRNFISSFSILKKKFITSSGDGDAGIEENPRKSYLFDWEGKFIKELSDPDGVEWAEFSPDGSKILGRCQHGTIVIWDANGNVINRIGGYTTNNLSDAKFSPDGTEILRVGEGKVQWFNLEGLLIHELTFPGKNIDCSALFNSTDDKIILNNRYVFGRYDQKPYELLSCLIEGVVLPGLKYMVSRKGAERCVCRIDTNVCWNNPDLKGYSLILSASGKEMVSWPLERDNGYYAMVWNLDTGPLDTIYAGDRGTSYSGGSVTFLNRDSAILINNRNGRLFLYLRKNRKRINFPVEKVTGVDISEKTDEIITLSLDTTLRIWKPSGVLVDSFKAPGVDFETGLSQNADHILFWSQESMFFLDRKTRTWKVEKAFFPTDNFNRIVLSQRKNLFLTINNENRAVSVWDYSGKRHFFFTAHEKEKIFYALFSPDERYVLTYSEDGTAKLWDVAYEGRGNNLVGIYKHDGRVNSAVFSSDGRYVMTAGSDSTVRIYPTPETIYEWVKNGTYPSLYWEYLIGLGLEGE